MTFSPPESARFRPYWRQLAQRASACAADPRIDRYDLRALGRTRETVCPSADRAEVLACGALKAVALAFEAETGLARRAALAPALAVFAAAVGDILDATDPANEPVPLLPPRRHRADIDG